jgi:hypothetical protein
MTLSDVLGRPVRPAGPVILAEELPSHEKTERSSEGRQMEEGPLRGVVGFPNSVCWLLALPPLSRMMARAGPVSAVLRGFRPGKWKRRQQRGAMEHVKADSSADKMQEGA